MQLAKDNAICGMVVAAFGAVFAVIAGGYDLGTLANAGPGLFPFGLAVILILLGGLIAIQPAEEHDEPMPPIPWRAVILLLGAAVFFAASIRHLGLVPTTFIAAVMAGLSTPRNKLLPIMAIAAVLALGATIIFIYGLRMPVAAFGSAFGG